VGRGLPGDGTELGALDGRGEKRRRYMAIGMAAPRFIDPDSFNRRNTELQQKSRNLELSRIGIFRAIELIELFH